MTFNSKLNPHLRLVQLQILMKAFLVFGMMALTPALTHAQWTTPNEQGHINNTNTGNVGIGTSTPGAPLEISKAQNAGTTLVVDNGYNTGGNQAYSGLFFKQAGANRFAIASINDGNTAQAGGPGAVQLVNFANGPMMFFTNSVERLRVTATGNVGIGTTSPGVGGIGFSSYMTLASSSGSRPVFEFVSNNGDHAGSEAGFLDFIINTNSVGHKSIGFISFETEGTTPNQRGGVMRLFTKANAGAASERMRINSSGNVGIGTTSPSYRLDVNGEINATGLRINGTSISNGPGVSSVFGRNGTVVAATNDYTWAQINKSTSSLGDLTTRSAGDLNAGTVPIGRLGASGTANSTTFLRGDNTWAVPSGGSQWNNSGTNDIYFNSGNVGIGISAPASKLHVGGGTRIDGTSGRLYLGTGAVTNNRGLEIIEENATTFSIRHHDPGVTWQNIAINPHGGNVGIGTATPNGRFEVAGGPIFFGDMGNQGWGNMVVRGRVISANNSIHLSPPGGSSVYIDSGYREAGGSAGPVNLSVSGDLNAAGTITGGNIVAKYQDLAEWVESSQELPAGTLVVVDHTRSNQVIASSQAYDTRVAGVISVQPGIALGESGENKLLVATTGRVRIKVDASRAPIQIGDLLVTSDIPGVAMKSQPINVGGTQLHRPGTIIGKALEPLAKGRGSILALLSLQ